MNLAQDYHLDPPPTSTNGTGVIVPFEILFVFSHICVLPALVTYTLFDNIHNTLSLCPYVLRNSLYIVSIQ